MAVGVIFPAIVLLQALSPGVFAHLPSDARFHHRRGVVKETTQLFNTSELPSLSNDCATALSQPVGCSPLLRYADGYSALESLFTADNLTTLCTQACTDSLSSVRDNVTQACGDEVYTDPPQNATGYVYGTGVLNNIYNEQRVSVKPVAFLDSYILSYHLICLQDGEKPPHYCYELARKNASSIDPCGPCILGAMHAQLEDARTYDDDLASAYSASVSSCGATALPVTTPSSVFLPGPSSSANHSATPTCTGSHVPIPTAASCDDFAANNSIATDQLLMLNGLAGGCANWPGNLTKACVQQTCKTYRVQQNDTCISVARAHGIRLSQLLSYNPWIDPVCANFHTQVGHVICVGNQVGWTPPVDSTTSTSTILTTTAAVPSNAADGSNKRCAKWYSVQKGDTCNTIKAKFDISKDDLHFLNPELNRNCTNLLAKESYCVAAVGHISTYSGYGEPVITAPPLSIDPSLTWSLLPTAALPTYPSVTTTASSYPLASGSLNGCYEMFQNNYGPISCWSAANILGVPAEQFIKWNPSVLNGNTYNGTNCRLANETEYCGSFYNPSNIPSSSISYPPVPTDATANATDECIDWYLTVKGDTCDSVCRIFDISISSFQQWNPAVGDKCGSFKQDTSYCVIGPGWRHVSYNTTSSPTATTATETSTTSKTTDSQSTSSAAGTGKYTTPPAPTQTGIPGNCNLYAVAQKGDGCKKFATRYGLTLDQLYKWNPVLNHACKNFWSKEAYCIGVK